METESDRLEFLLCEMYESVTSRKCKIESGITGNEGCGQARIGTKVNYRAPEGQRHPTTTRKCKEV